MKDRCEFTQEGYCTCYGSVEEQLESSTQWECNGSHDEMLECGMILETEVACNIKGTVICASPVNKRMVHIQPVEHHYENKGETPYIKYGCPICEAFGNRHSFYRGMENCSLCGINFKWD